MQTTPLSIVLDFDGVIVDSVAIKSQAFQDAYSDATPEQLAAIDRYHHAHGGVSRREKFRHFETAIFGREADPAVIEALSELYRSIVYDKVVACRLIPGALDFLAEAAARMPLHLVSGTPQGELEAIVASRGLRHFFQRVIGAPTLKLAAFAALAREDGHDPHRVVAIGDSTTEFDAARELEMPFVGIVAEGIANPFPPAIPVLPDMTGLARQLGFTAKLAAAAAAS
ncbi:HAD family hydrolase [Bosea sp. (in: a-proteobacteria)]|uniref:HAD family hydrolase n=1 Tax=Bosea sp. (in: a-proteobacteria) TaxID=1871050 RepID=UPI002FC88E05